jgi:aminocarboxymuconate-semialdehyde decarboxylase
VRIDVHNHVIPARVIEVLRGEPAYRVSIEAGHWRGGNHVDFQLSDSFVEPEAKFAELERNGLDGAVLSGAPPLFYYELDPEAGETLCRAVNEGLRDFRNADPSRLWWLAHLPLQDPERAVRLLEEEARTEACVGIHIGSSIRGARLDEEHFETFWAAAERMQLPVVIHPDPSYSAVDGLGPFYLENVIGMPLETTITIKRLISAGVLERHPRAQVVLLHGGGYFPYQAGRLNHARTVRRELAGSPNPWNAFGQLWFDVITHDAEALRYLVSRAGIERVVLGSDLPFDMALAEPARGVEQALGGDALHQIAEVNPVRLFHLSSDDRERERQGALRNAVQAKPSD